MALLARGSNLDTPDGFAAHRIADGFYASGELTGNVTLDATYPNRLRLDPGGSHRDVTLPAVATSEGMWYRITNGANAAENLVVKSAAGTIATINQNEQAEFWCIDGAWVVDCVITIALS